MENENGRMAAMQAEFQKVREDLTARLRVEEAANQRMREEAKREKSEQATEKEATAMGTGATARQGPGGQGVSTSVNYSLIRLHYSIRSPPKMPNDPAKTLSWIVYH